MYSFTVERTAVKRSKQEKVNVALQKMVEAALRGNRGTLQGWFVVGENIAAEPIAEGNNYIYSHTFYFDKKNANAVDQKTCEAQFDVLVRMAVNAGLQSNWELKDKNYNVSWELPTHILPANLPSAEQNTELDISIIDRTPIEFSSESLYNLNPDGFFDDIYDRNDQINVVLSDLHTCIESNFEIRNHTILYGDVSAGKTTLCKKFMEMIGEEYCHYVDMTTTTAAGILSELMEISEEVKFIIIEELEKCSPEHLKWLLGVMDSRAMLNVCNAKVGVLRRKMPVYIIANVNDMVRLKKFHSGAVLSRFGNKVYCPTLSRDTIYKAVKQAVDKVEGDEAWINPAIDYCLYQEKTRDIRRIKTIALSGRSRLLNGEYQAILKATSCPK